MSVSTTHPPVVLEPESQAFVEATSKPPFVYELTPAEGRKVFDDVQAAPIDKLPVAPRLRSIQKARRGRRTDAAPRLDTPSDLAVEVALLGRRE
jgi:hypothetical protein